MPDIKALGKILSILLFLTFMGTQADASIKLDKGWIIPDRWVTWSEVQSGQVPSDSFAIYGDPWYQKEKYPDAKATTPPLF